MNSPRAYTVAVVGSHSFFLSPSHWEKNLVLCAKNEMFPKQLSDEALAARVAQGDTAAFETLYDRHAARVLGVCLRITGDHVFAEDLLQETFWRVWQNAGSYQPERGSFTSWLFRIARNLSIDAYRRDQNRPLVIDSSGTTGSILEQIPDVAINVPEQAESHLDAEQLQDALASLPREQRQVIELAYFYGLTRHEIAAMTGEAVGTIHTRARLGLQKLRESFSRKTAK